MFNPFSPSWSVEKYIFSGSFFEIYLLSEVLRAVRHFRNTLLLDVGNGVCFQHENALRWCRKWNFQLCDCGGEISMSQCGYGKIVHNKTKRVKGTMSDKQCARKRLFHIGKCYQAYPGFTLILIFFWAFLFFHSHMKTSPVREPRRG